MLEDRWLNLITDNGTVDVQEEIPGLLFLGARESLPVTITNNVKMQGVDGELPGVINYDPFNLTVYLGFDGYDIEDVDLAEQKIRGLFNTRTRYFLVHSQMPGKKYAVDPPEIGPPEFLDATALTFEITFNVYKGYSESLLTTDEMSLGNHTEWQFGNNMIAFDESDNYHHRTKTFRIYNGSDDIIDPTLHHILNITIHTNAPNGFKLRNRKTGDVFEYYGSLLYTDTFMLKGVYPVVNGKRVGADTNNSWITLKKGFNDFIVTGDGITDFDITFSFPFIYR